MLRVAFRLEEKSGTEPDIGFVKKSRLHLAKRGYFDGPPDAAFEIVSPESVERDYVKKRRLYEKHRVGEYWIIDEMEETVTLLRLNKRGKYQEVRAKGGLLHSEVIDGFRLDPNWLWQSPRPYCAARIARGINLTYSDSSRIGRSSFGGTIQGQSVSGMPSCSGFGSIAGSSLSKSNQSS
jgi:hypothetical protein